MKKQLIEAIKAKFVGIDENTAKRLAERAIAKSENGISSEDEVNVAVEAITLADVLKSVNDFSADDAIKKYEEKYGLEKGEKKDKQDKDKDKDKSTDPDKDKDKDKDKSKDNAADEAFKAMLKEFKESMTAEFNAIKGDLNAMKNGKISETRRAKLDAIIKDLKDFQKKPYGRIDLGKMSDDEFESFLTDVKEEVGDAIAENRASESRVSPLFGGGNRQKENNTRNSDVKEASKEEIDALVGKFGLQEKS